MYDTHIHTAQFDFANIQDNNSKERFGGIVIPKGESWLLTGFYITGIDINNNSSSDLNIPIGYEAAPKYAHQNGSNAISHNTESATIVFAAGTTKDFATNQTVNAYFEAEEEVRFWVKDGTYASSFSAGSVAQGTFRFRVIQ